MRYCIARRWRNWTIESMTVAITAALAGCAANQIQLRPGAETAGSPARAGTPYLGLLLGEGNPPDGAVVRWAYPGPLRPTGDTSALVARGDQLLSVDGKAVNAAELQAYVAARKPGDTIDLRVRRTDADPDAMIATPGKGTNVVALRVQLSAKEMWCGPVEFEGPKIVTGPASPFTGQPVESISANDPMAKACGDVNAYIQRRVDQNGLREPVDKLIAMFRMVLGEQPGANMLQVVRDSYLHPSCVLSNEVAITRSFKEAAEDPRKAIPWAWVWNNGRDVPKPATPDVPALSKLPDPVDLQEPAKALELLSSRCESSTALVDGALGQAYDLSSSNDQQRKRLRGRLDRLLQASTDMSFDTEDPRDMIDVMQRSTRIDFDRLYSAGHVLAGFMVKSAPPARATTPVPIPRALKDAVTGEILAARKSGGRWYVYGGFTPNAYDMTRISGVIDPGGGDSFLWPQDEEHPDVRSPAVQVIVDMGGTNTYAGSSSGGPGVGVMGVNLVVDYGGHSTFTGDDMASGVGYLGVGIVVCHEGDNRFEGKSWTQGVGYYGFGAILNLGALRNDYIAWQYSQGVGGPRGIGLILDRGGNSFFLADGPVPSSYSMAGARFSMSQGVGYGLRDYDSGGLGVILSLGAEAHYVGGEFSQGGGYYWGMGIIHNAGPRNTFQGNRYSQGFGCHQAIGIVDNESGGNLYWSTIAANQGAAWDVSTGILIDRQGGNTYSGGDISQGSAAMQGIGWLLNLDGPNEYRSSAGATQGKSSGNSYHFDQTGCYSFSVLLDAQGDKSRYSKDRPNGQTITTGEKNDRKPEDSTLHGLFISVPGKIDWGN